MKGFFWICLEYPNIICLLILDHIGQIILEQSSLQKIMQKVWIKLTTNRQKKGSLNYFVPVPTFSSECEITEDDKALMKKYAETVKAHNENIMEQYRETTKLNSPAEDANLAGDFDNVANA